MTSNSHDVFRDWFPFVLVFLPASGLILLPFPCEDFNQVFSLQFYFGSYYGVSSLRVTLFMLFYVEWEKVNVIVNNMKMLVP